MNKSLTIIAYLVHFITLVGLFILEKLTKTKAGVNHHIIARKHQWAESFLSETNLASLSKIAIVIFLIALALAIFNSYKKNNGIHFYFLAILQIGLLGFMNVESLTNITSSYYVIVGLSILTILQIILSLTLATNCKKQ